MEDTVPAKTVNIDTKSTTPTRLELFLLAINVMLCGVFLFTAFIFILLISGIFGKEYEQTFDQLIGINKVPPIEDPRSPDFDLVALRKAAEKEQARSTKDRTRGTTSDPAATTWEEAQRRYNNEPEPPKSSVKKVNKDGTKQSW